MKGGIFFIFFACILWALDSLIRYPLLSKVAAPNIVFIEHFFLFIIALFLVKGKIHRFGKLQVNHLANFFVIGALGSALATLAFTEAFNYLNLSVVILLQKLQPLVALFFAWIILKEKIHFKFVVFAFITLVGGVLVSYEDLFLGPNNILKSWNASPNIWGYFLALLAVFFWGSSTVFGKKLAQQKFSTQDILGGRFIMGFLAMLILFPVFKYEWQVEPHSLLKILSMALLSGVISLYFYYRGLRQIPAKLGALAETFFPFCAICLNWLVLDKGLSGVQLIGGGLLILGSTVIQLMRY